MTKNLTQVLAQSISIIKEIPIPHALLIAICILIIWVTLDVSESINFRNALKHNSIHIQLKKNPSKESFPDELTWFSEQIKEGDNLSTVFDRIDISSADLVYIMSAAKDANLNQVLPGESLLFGISKRSGGVMYGIMVLPHIVTKMRATKRFIKLGKWREFRRVRWRARRYS